MSAALHGKSFCGLNGRLWGSGGFRADAARVSQDCCILKSGVQGLLSTSCCHSSLSSDKLCAADQLRFFARVACNQCIELACLCPVRRACKTFVDRHQLYGSWKPIDESINSTCLGHDGSQRSRLDEHIESNFLRGRGKA